MEIGLHLDNVSTDFHLLWFSAYMSEILLFGFFVTQHIMSIVVYKEHSNSLQVVIRFGFGKWYR